MKICTKCNVEKDLNDFRMSKRGKDGFYPQCKVCVDIERRKWLDANPNYERDWKRKNEGKNFGFSKCHPDIRAFRQSSGLCRPCYERDLKIRNPEYAERQKQNNKNWSILNKEKLKNYALRRKEDPLLKERDKETHRNCTLKRKYGITANDFDMMFYAQDKKCFLCLLESDKTLHVDHNHTTGKVRKLLCHRCNFLVVGQLENNIELYKKAISYLENFK